MINGVRFFRVLQASASSRLGVDVLAPAVADWLTRIGVEVVSPTLANPGVAVREVGMGLHSAVNMLAPRIREYSPEAWLGSIRDFRAGKFAGFHLVTITNDERVSTFLDVEFYPWRIDDPERSNAFNVQVVEVCFDPPGVVPAELVDGLVGAFRDLSTAVEIDGGLMTFDFPGHGSPYEAAHGNADRWSQRYHERVRGFYWGNLLGERHLELLGGFDRVSEEAPVFKVEDWSNGAKTRAWLQLTDDINNVTDDELRALRDFLKPALFEPEFDARERFPEQVIPYRVYLD